MTRIVAASSIVTMDPARPVAQWIELDGPRIVAMGGGAPARRPDLDFGPATVLPGFHDAHVHPPLGGLAMIRCDLHDVADAAGYVSAIATYARRHPELPWILGGGWAMEAFPAGVASAAQLDAVVPDRPVFLHSREGHAAWVNTKAMQMAGIDGATPDPPDGRIERGQNGEPVGTLQEGAADLVERIAPQPGVEDYVNAIAAAQDKLLSLGVTAWQDAWVTQPIQAAYRTLDERGGLVATVRGALWWERDGTLDQIDDVVLRSEERSPRFDPRSVKLMVDGVCENGTASMLAPYAGSSSRGIQFISRDTLLAAVPRLMAAGLQPHFHAIGDRAIRDALDAVAAGDAGDIARTRPHIAHIQVIQPADVARFAALGVVANAQAYWACNDVCMTELTAPRLGPERTALQYPFRALLDAGARLAAGSDWPVSTADPFAQIAVAVTRVQPGFPQPFVPDQALTIGEALAACTTEAAWVSHQETRRGSLASGMVADFVVVGRNPQHVPPDELHEIVVMETFVAGQRVHPR